VRDRQDQLEWEARAGRLAAAAAIGSALMVIGSFAARIGIGPGSSKKAESLRIAHDNAGLILTYAVLTALSFLLLSVVLLYLYRAARFRRAELPPVAAITAVLGPVLLSVTTIAGSLLLADAADEFVSSGAQTEARAKDLAEGGATGTFQALGLAGSLITGIAIVVISLNAMRAGLLSRFMGALGMLLGALLVLPIIPAPVIQLFWLLALGTLFLGRWPGGRGPAWASGEAEPWPTAQDRYAAQEDGAGQAHAEAEAAPAEPEPPQASRPRSRKRKKKKARR